MDQENKNFKEQFYLILTGIFIASLVASNLIFQKFFTWNFLGIDFELSVGIIAYPVTFLVTDLISELYGQKRANQVVVSGFFASVFTTLLVLISANANAVEWSPIDNTTFTKVFGLTGPAFFASMVAYLSAQLIDVRIFHFWKRLTKGKHLWLRNNASTMFSQLVDTSVILIILCSAGVIEWERFYSLWMMGWLFKVLVALIDTPIIYGVIYLIIVLILAYFFYKEGISIF